MMSNENLCVDFPKCVSLFLDFIKKKQATDSPLTWTIAQVSKKHGHGGSLVQVKDRYYNKKEYCALMAKQKSELCHKCQNNGHKPRDKSSKKGKTGGNELEKGIATMSHTIAQTVVTALAVKEKDKTVSFLIMTRPT